MSQEQNLLISTEWLANHLYSPTVRIVDIRGHVLPANQPTPHYFNHQDAYLQEHIPGAVFIDWVHEINDPDDPRHAQIAKPDRFASVMRRNGINNDTLVVVYDDADSMFAARLWWALNYYGHDKVAVLDGGWKKWLAEKRPVSGAIPDVMPGNFVPQIKSELRWTADQVLQVVEHGDSAQTKLLDVRTKEEFAGKYARAKRTGHIPGAINTPRNEFVLSDGTMPSPEALKQKFAEVGIDESTPEVVIYCNGGVSASYGLLALRVAGIEHGAVYDGSWKEWGNDDSKPVSVETANSSIKKD